MMADLEKKRVDVVVAARLNVFAVAGIVRLRNVRDARLMMKLGWLIEGMIPSKHEVTERYKSDVTVVGCLSLLSATWRALSCDYT